MRSAMALAALILTKSGLTSLSTFLSYNLKSSSPKESFKKCVINQPPGNIYNIGDIIHFKYSVGNGGAGSLSETITDNMGLPSQNLQIIPSSITYSYYVNNLFSPYNPFCINSYSNQQTTLPFSVSADTADLQNPVFTIDSMPGICDYNKGNYLIIKFDAKILSQMYGNKINTAHTTYNQSSASYTIDQLGVLEVSKHADQEFVDNGGNFNYIIEVKNSGSVPLDHIVVSDNLPDCVSAQYQQIAATDMSGQNVNIASNTATASLVVTLNPAFQIAPNETVTITIPTTKNGGGNCCNVSVTADATMITNQVQLHANNGSTDEPAACVKSTQCCDILDFDAQLYDNGNGTYSVSINGGTTPLQQVDISMMDYHVVYNHRDCKPQDMGIFSTLSTQSQQLGSLVLDGNTNNTYNLTWQLGNPSVINNTIDLNVSQPNVLQLDCCKAQLYFCLKVTAKDVNCNVCQKIICVEPHKPCDLSIKPLHDTYCTGDPMTISYNGQSSSGQVNIDLLEVGGNGHIQIAANQPDNGTFTWTIPASINPCDVRWQVVISDAEQPDHCHTASNIITIKCCEPCDCGKWGTDSVAIKGFIKRIPNDPKLKIYTQLYLSKLLKCGGKIKLKKGADYSFTAPTYICSTKNCDVTYKWEVEDSNGISQSGFGKTFNYNFSAATTYTVTFTPICGGKRCSPCKITVIIE